MEFEDILHEVGGYGKFQKYLTVFFLIPISCILPMINLNTLFMVSVPDHWCYVPMVASSNLSVAEQRALISPSEDPHCTMYDTDYSQYLTENITDPNVTNAVPCRHGWQYDKQNYESTAATKWNLVCDYSYFPSLVLSLQNFGSLALTPVYSFLADRFGRKKVYLLLAVLSCTTELLSILVDNFIAFAVFRAIHGSVLPTMFSLPFILLIEIVAPEMRAHMNGIINSFWTVGLCTLPLLAYLSGNWLYLGFICALICSCNLIYWKFIPESPCWLISRGRYEEAATIMEGIGQRNGKYQDRIDLYKQIKVLGENIKKKKEMENRRYLDLLLKYPRIRKHFFILAFCWATFYISYFGPMYNIRNLSGNEFINFFLLSVVEIPGNFAFWILMDRAGRRWTSSVGFILIGCVTLGPISGLEYSDIICSMLSKFISTGIFMVTDQQASELFPTVARSFGMGFAKTVANASTLFVPFFSDLGAYGKELPFVVMSVTSFTAGIMTTFLPETLNENLPQTISDAEAFGKDQKFFSWIRKRRVTDTEENSKSGLKNECLISGKENVTTLMLIKDSCTEADAKNLEITELSGEPLIQDPLNVEIECKNNSSEV